jgi:predicted DNA-binding transcriptional regulator YafY
MSTQGTIHRYSLIIEKLERNQYPDLKELHDFIFEMGFENSQRTLQRDIKALKEEFGVWIELDKSRGGYYIDHELSDDFETLVKLFNLNISSQLFGDLIKNKELLPYIDFEHSGQLHGINLLKPLTLAVKEHRYISFRHFNFHKGKTRKYNIKPYLLKEYQGRWYVIGLIANQKEFRTFGVDRIQDLEIQSRTFEYHEELNPKENFRHTIGLTYSLAKPIRVVLSFTPAQGQYVKHLPLHSSQKELIDNTEEYRIELFVVPNFELQQRIWSYGPLVKVLEPEGLESLVW